MPCTGRREADKHEGEIVSRPGDDDLSRTFHNFAELMATPVETAFSAGTCLGGSAREGSEGVPVPLPK